MIVEEKTAISRAVDREKVKTIKSDFLGSFIKQID